MPPPDAPAGGDAGGGAEAPASGASPAPAPEAPERIPPSAFDPVDDDSDVPEVDDEEEEEGGGAEDEDEDEGDDDEADDEEEEGDDDDDGEADDEPDADALHGVSREHIFASLSEGKLPDELASEIKVTVPVPDGDPIEVSVEEARRGYMRISDYSRNKHRAKQREREADAKFEQTAAMFRRWKDPKLLRSGLQALGLWGSFLEASRSTHAELTALAQLKESNPELYEERMSRIRVEADRDRLQAERDNEAEARRHAPQGPTAEQQALANKMEPLVQAAFREHSIPDVKRAREEFAKAMQALEDDPYGLYEGEEGLAQLVHDSAKNAREELNAAARGYRLEAEEGDGEGGKGKKGRKTRRGKKGRKPPVARAGTSSTSPRTPASKMKRQRVSDFDWGK